MKIKCLILDVDGTLTDGKIYYGNDGEEFKAFSVKDGYRLNNCGDLMTAIITGRTSKIVQMRAQELNITHVLQGVRDKAQALKELARENNLSLDEMAYIGDDLNDLEAMNLCALKGCPCDSASEIVGIADYVCKNAGGNGAVREFIEYILSIG